MLLGRLCLTVSLAFSANAMRIGNRNGFDFGSLLGGVLGAVAGGAPGAAPPGAALPVTAAQSAESLKEMQGYAAIKAQQE